MEIPEYNGIKQGMRAIYKTRFGSLIKVHVEKIRKTSRDVSAEVRVLEADPNSGYFQHNVFPTSTRNLSSV